MVLVGVVVFGWGITDCIIDFVAADGDAFLEYYKQDTRTLIYALSSYSWLFFRFVSILFFANALHRFWSVFQQVKDEEMTQNKNSFYTHLLLVIAYFLALSLLAGIFLVSWWSGVFLQRFLLLTFMFASTVGLANYIFIILVAKEMYVHYLEKKRQESQLASCLENDINDRISYLVAEV